MRRRERVLKLHNRLKRARTPVDRHSLMHELECSEATFFRVLAELRDAYGAPVVASAEPAGYRYEQGAESFELPGLWFTAEEMFALLAAEQLLADLDPGLLGESLDLLRDRLRTLLGEGRQLELDNLRRIRILRMLGRGVEPMPMRLCARAVLTRCQLEFSYAARSTERVTQRRVCPQRLTHYRDNWYLDAWCHRAEALRTFSVDRMSEAVITPDTARDIDDDALDLRLGSAYGIFAGEADRRAVLRFSAERARWVADEIWHPLQTGQWLEDGRYELRFPYAQPQELIMDILRHGEAAEVVAPADLRREVGAALVRAARRYNE